MYQTPLFQITTMGDNKLPSSLRANPGTYTMLVEAVTELDDRKGVSVPAIKAFIMEKYPTADQSMLKYRLKKALQKGLEGGAIARPKGSEDAGE